MGTETLPALALGREPAEPGLMDRPPRPRDRSVVDAGMLARAWLFVGVIAAALATAAFFRVLVDGGWTPGAAVGAGTPLHQTYLRAVSTSFLAIVMAQVGTAMAARTERSSLRSIGLLSNPLLLWGIAFEVAFAAAIIYLPPLQQLFGTASLGLDVLLLVAPFPFIVWGADELRRFVVRRRQTTVGRRAGASVAGGGA